MPCGDLSKLESAIQRLKDMGFFEQVCDETFEVKRIVKARINPCGYPREDDSISAPCNNV